MQLDWEKTKEKPEVLKLTEFEDELSVNDADLQLKNELISEWRMNVQEKLSKKPELRRETRTLGESMEPRRQPEGATVHDRPSQERTGESTQKFRLLRR